jgi:hypothetical protein
MEARGGERRPDHRQPSSWTARILAPLALALVAIVVVVVASDSLSGSNDDGDRNDRENRAQVAGCQPDADQAVEDGYYVIEPGEDLSIVADRTCIPVDRLIDLNENLDPQAIQPASCVDLRVDGCKALAEG